VNYLRRIPALVLVAALVLTGCARKGPNSATSSGTSPPATSMSSMEKMTKPLAGADLDRAFIEGMVPHHQAAIDMAKVELEKGKNQRVKALAQTIVNDQQREIAEMTTMAKERFQFTPMPEMSGPMGAVMGVPMSMDMAKMGEELAGASNTDQAFLSMMIPHHASAILMASEESRNGGDADLKKVAASIIAAQAKEIGEMQALLASGV
jgi:uncharacterized protein (DUF305 family)